MPETESPQVGVTSPVIRCSANFPHDGSDIAVAMLMIQMTDHKSWVCYPRCKEHDANTYFRLVGIIHPGQLAYVMPLLPRLEVY